MVEVQPRLRTLTATRLPCLLETFVVKLAEIIAGQRLRAVQNNDHADRENRERDALFHEMSFEAAVCCTSRVFPKGVRSFFTTCGIVACLTRLATRQN